VNNISLIIYGTKDRPAHYASPKVYKNVDLKKMKTDKENPIDEKVFLVLVTE
jgi:hypothetical protein